MSNYSHVNFEDLEPTTTDGGFELRFGRKRIDSSHLGVSRLRFEPEVRSPVAHKHREQEEAYVIASGSGRALLDGELVELRPGDVLRVAPQTVRSFEAGADGLELIAIGGPRPEGGDGERVEVAWPDA